MTATIPGFDVQALRAAEYPWMLTGAATYLNNASLGPLPERTLRATVEFNQLRAEPHKMTVAKQFGILAECRELAARLVGGKASEIALMVNTTYGLNVASSCLPLADGDVVLSFDREFPSNVYPWMALGKRGVTFTQLPCVNGWPDEDALVAAIATTPRLKVVAISWVSFATGYRVDLQRIGEACRARGGVTFVVDAMQGLGVVPMDVEAWHIDMLSCGGQKWLLSPWGTGFVWVRESLVKALDPNPVGWMSPAGTDDFSKLTDYRMEWRDDARRFEVISLPFQDFVGFAAGVGMLLDVGIPRVHAHVEGVVSAGIAAAREHGLKVVTPEDVGRRAGVFGVVPRDDAGMASARLAAAGVTHSVREGSIRLSPHLFSLLREVEVVARLVAQG